MEITGMNNGRIFCYEKSTKTVFEVTAPLHELVNVRCQKDGAPHASEWKDCDLTPEQWRNFFSCYLVAKNNQLSGKLHSIIESFGGSEQEVKARKSVAFQLLGFKSLS